MHDSTGANLRILRKILAETVVNLLGPSIKRSPVTSDMAFSVCHGPILVHTRIHYQDLA